MGRRGPPKTPTALQISRGNPGHRPINTEEPVLETSPVEPPASLKGIALKEWNRLVGELVKKGVLTIGDRVVFENYCQLVREVEEYRKLVAKVGRQDAHRLGYAGHLLKIRGQLKQFAAELGLSPTSRSSVKAVKASDTGNARRKRFFGVPDNPAKRQA